MPYEPPPELASLSLEQIATLVVQRNLPPVEQWEPHTTGDSLIRIHADGRWFHDGGEITRPAMVRAFSSLLKCDCDGGYWLVTPQEKLSIAVDDAPFIAVDVARKDGALVFRLNTDELVLAGPDHPLIARGDVETPALYLAVRDRLEARINRSTWLQLVDLANKDLCIASLGAVFPLVPE